MYSPFGKQQLYERFGAYGDVITSAQKPDPKDKGPYQKTSLVESSAPDAVVGLLTNYFDAEGNQIQNPTFLLTLRSSNLSSHASQVALPGGLVDPEDELNSIVTLTREFEEEVGISPRKVEWLPKSLGFALSRNGLNVECRVGTVLEPIEILKLDEKEVSEAAWVPMDLLVNSDFWGYRDFLVQKSHAEWQTVPLPYWTGWTYSVWGLTGGFLRRFVRTFHPEFF